MGRSPEASRRPRTPFSPPEEIRYGRSRTCRRGWAPPGLTRRPPAAAGGEDPRCHLRPWHRPGARGGRAPASCGSPSTARPGPTSSSRSIPDRARYLDAGPRHAAPPGRPDGHPRRLRDRAPGRGHQRRRADHLVGEAIEVHHGDGLVEQQMFTLPINALPSDIPTAIEADMSGLTIGGQVRVSDLVLPPGVTTDVEPESAVAIGQPPRVVVEEAAAGEGARRSRRGRDSGGRAGRGGIRGHVRRGLGPAPPLCPVRAPGHTGGLARRRAGQPGDGVRREPAQRGLRRGGAAGRTARCVPARREGCGGAGGRGHPRRAGGWRSPSRRPT